jgi:hypothetical protein
MWHNKQNMASCCKRGHECRCGSHFGSILNQTIRRCSDRRTDSFDIDAGRLVSHLSTPKSVSVNLKFTADNNCLSEADVELTCVWPELTIVVVDAEGKEFQYRVLIDGSETVFTDGIKAARFCRAHMARPKGGWWPIDESDDDGVKDEVQDDEESEDSEDERSEDNDCDKD